VIGLNLTGNKPWQQNKQRQKQTHAQNTTISMQKRLFVGFGFVGGNLTNPQNPQNRS
jgi:hypothetical protein